MTPAVMWMSPPWPSTALAMIWLFSRMTNSGSMLMLPPVVCAATDRGRHLAVTQPHHGLGAHLNVAPIGLGGLGGHGTVFTQEGIGGPDGDATSIPRPSTLCGDCRPLTELDGGALQANITPPATPLQW